MLALGAKVWKNSGNNMITTVPSTRKEIPLLLNQMGLVGRGVEVGVYKGGFSKAILDLWNGERLYSVDAWTFQSDVILDKSNVSDAEHMAAYNECIDVLRPFGTRSKIIRGFSETVATIFEDGSLDFVYLDARHDYRSVTADLEAWWPKIKAGGILSGHDYFDKFVRKNLVEVKRAVDTFFQFGQLAIVHQTTDDNLPSWIVQK